MARPEKPVLGVGPVADFARELRRLRADNQNPPYATMAKKAQYSKTVLSQAAAGHRLPTWEAVHGFLRSLGINEDSLTYLGTRARWDMAKELNAEPTPRRDREKPHRPIDPDDIQTPAEYAAALGAMLARSGLSIRKLADATVTIAATDREIVAGISGFRHPLSRDAIANVLKGRRAPTVDFVYTFVRACGHSTAEAKSWARQSRVIELEHHRASVALRALQQPAATIGLRVSDLPWQFSTGAAFTMPQTTLATPIRMPRPGAHRAPADHWWSRIFRPRRTVDDPALLDDGRG